MNRARLDKCLQDADIQTPAYLFDLDQILDNLLPLQNLRRNSGCQVLYSIKALPLVPVMQLLQDRVDGFSVSSLFEARLARDILGETGGTIHLTSPGLRSDQIAEIGDLSDYISFNSLSQYQRLSGLASNYSKGLRLNPKLSFLNDQRFDPCRLHSKLGIDIADLLISGLPAEIEGLHFHTVFSQTDFNALHQTIEKLSPILQSNCLQWINFGGGYLYNQIQDQQSLIELINALHAEFQLKVILEPGKAIVGNAGYLLSTVVDQFVSDGKSILVMDTSVNHHPEVFEYQRKPQLYPPETGNMSAIVVGGSCLAGDLFGEYHFDRIPRIGERLLFESVGAYSLIKANRFNGLNLPSIYLYQNAKLTLYKEYDYFQYREQWQS